MEERLEWLNIPFEIFLIKTPEDGNCLFHAICNGFSKSYRKQSVNVGFMSRNDIVTVFRRELASKLGEIHPSKRGTRYELISNGNLKELGDSGRQEYTFNGLKSWLESNYPMGDEIVEYISSIIDINIYFLDTRTQDVYNRKCLEILNAPCIVLFYNGGHYDLCGIMSKGGVMGTLFSYDDPFIKYIRNRIYSR